MVCNDMFFAEKAEGSGALKDEDVDEGDKRILMPGLLNYRQFISP